LEVQQLHLQKWLGIFPSATTDPRSFLDWSYYRQRLETAILKIIVVPALHQGVENPVPRVVPPEWIIRNISLTRSTQTRLSNFFTTNAIQNELPSTTPSSIRSALTLLHSPFNKKKEDNEEESFPVNEKEKSKKLTQQPDPSLNSQEASLVTWFNRRKNSWKKIRYVSFRCIV
jgi:DNA polymerase epsilon subunit 1